MTIESENLKQEIKEIVEPCINCGLCKNLCVLTKVLRQEQFSPRGKAIMLNKGIYEKILYKDTLSGSCEKTCPVKIKMHEAIIKSRQVLVQTRIETQENKEIIKNLETTGNIFGEKS